MFMDWYFYHQPTVGSDYTRPVLSVFSTSHLHFVFFIFCMIPQTILSDNTLYLHTICLQCVFIHLEVQDISQNCFCRGSYWVFPAEVFFSRTYCTLIWSKELSSEFCLFWILFPFVFLICHIEAENICLSTHAVGIAPYHQLYCRLSVFLSLICLPGHFVFVSVVMSDEWFYCGNKRLF